jgi:hypothetical protein
VKCIFEDMVELAKCKAAMGHDCVEIKPPYTEIKSPRHAEMAHMELIPRVVPALKDLGLNVNYIPGQPHSYHLEKLVVSWKSPAR